MGTKNVDPGLIRICNCLMIFGLFGCFFQFLSVLFLVVFDLIEYNITEIFVNLIWASTTYFIVAAALLFFNLFTAAMYFLISIFWLLWVVSFFKYKGSFGQEVLDFPELTTRRYEQLTAWSDVALLISAILLSTALVPLLMYFWRRFRTRKSH